MKKHYFLLICFLWINVVFSQNEPLIKLNQSKITIEVLLQKYIQIVSVSGNEKEAGDFLKSVCQQNNLHIADFGSSNGNYNFAASIHPLTSNKPNIIFLSHIDVVPENEDSPKGAYSGKIADGKVYGRGAIDNKGVGLMQLYGMIKWMHNNQVDKDKYNITLLAVSCEETQCDGGIEYVIENYFEDLNPAVVFGEGPSEITTLIGGEFKHPIFGVSLAHKRVLWLELELENYTSSHGSITPPSYNNKDLVVALNKLTKKKNKVYYDDININLLKSLANHKKGVSKFVLKHPKLFKPLVVPQLRKHPELLAVYSNTITITNIQANDNSHNKIPTKVRAYLDCRLLPNADKKEFLKMVRNRLDNDSIKISIIKEMPKTQYSSTKTSYYKNFEKAFLNKYPSAEVLPILIPSSNDLGVFRALNIPAYASIPAILPREEVLTVHNKNEHISIKYLYDGANIFYNLLKNMTLKTQIENN